MRWGEGGREVWREGWVEEEAYVWWGISTMRIFPSRPVVLASVGCAVKALRR